MIREEARQLIHKWLKGQLTKKERESFEEQMEDQKFREEVAVQSATAIALEKIHKEKDKKLLSFLVELDEAAREISETEVLVNPTNKEETPQVSRKEGSVKIRKLLPRYWRQIAAVLIVLGGGLFIMDRFLGPSSSRYAIIAESIIKPTEEQQKGGAASVDRLMGCSNLSDERIAFIQCMTTKEIPDTNWQAHSWLGYSYLLSEDLEDHELAFEQFDKSLSILQNLDKSRRPDQSVISQIEWNRLLSMIQVKSEVELKKEIDRFREDEDRPFYQKKADELHNELLEAKII